MRKNVSGSWSGAFVAAGFALAMVGCAPEPQVVYVQQPTSPPPPVYAQPQPVYGQPQQPAYQEPPPQPIEQEVVEPPIGQPPPEEIAYAPPPLLVDQPPPEPYPDAMWIGGYWHWDMEWVWFTGRWARPPRPDYYWNVPYYEHRGGMVVYVPGYWGGRGEVFVPPPPGMYIQRAPMRAGYVGAPPAGPQGVFISPPPGSRRGVIVPAPIGTHPAVVMSSPPAERPGMVVQAGAMGANGRPSVVVTAPAGVVRGGGAIHAQVPAQGHLAAALAPHPGAPSVNNVPVRPGTPRPAAVNQPMARPAVQPAMNQPRPYQPAVQPAAVNRPTETRPVESEPRFNAEQNRPVVNETRQSPPVEPVAKEPRVEDHNYEQPHIQRPVAQPHPVTAPVAPARRPPPPPPPPPRRAPPPPKHR